MIPALIVAASTVAMPRSLRVFVALLALIDIRAPRRPTEVLRAQDVF